MQDKGKLSGMRTGAGLDAMLAMLPPMTRIIGDERFSDIREKLRNAENAKVFDVAADVFPLMVKEHRTEVYQIVSAVTGKDAREIDDQPLCETMEAFTDAMGADVLGFFSFFAHMVARM